MSLSGFSSCEISDALIKLSLPHGGHIPDIHLVSPVNSDLRLCGPAYTVQFVLASDPSAPKLTTHFVDTVPEGSVILLDVPPQTKNAVWGGLMTAGALARGAKGVIISGRCRDIAEHRAQGFPVFSRAHSTLGQSPFTRPSAVNIPLTIIPQGPGADVFPAVTVQPGDWLIADEDGVVCIPKDLEAQVVELAIKGREIDDRCMKDIQAGKGVQQSFKLHRGK
ncbi:RraA-like protein [Gymnopilus junonius]|uniref:RraA-like protein n=1 Tax=Gymnopilus junonius TaxID=109634 RepID=A0A9P5TQA8_GYMJU|nr:RraA-like protein [Gymnopilus junonius]